MNYERIVKAKFIERENRFVARVRPEVHCDAEVRVHVKNTGRCRELLTPGATVYLDDHIDKMGSRKYRYDLVAVEKVTGDSRGKLLINMDSQAPNKVVHEALLSGSLELSELRSRDILIRPEHTYGTSRFDFFVEPDPSSPSPAPGKSPPRAFIEVKGVTLEEDGVARFPDAPTQRGVKHINELVQAASEGYGAYIIFVIQMKGVDHFEPNDKTHPEFGEALRHAKATGVFVRAYDCTVTENSLKLDRPVPVRL